jgi:hypothetical protein
MMHHRNEGHVMTQSQEEMAVIGILALFWVGEWKNLPFLRIGLMNYRANDSFPRRL